MISYDIESEFNRIMRAETYDDLDKISFHIIVLFDKNEINSTEFRMLTAWLRYRYLLFDNEQD